MQYEHTTPIRANSMHKAVEILNEYGEPTFNRFAYNNQLSYCDINRCIAKARIAYGTQIKEKPIPENLKQERWLFYTKVCRYPKEKALNMIKKIDTSYENQFVPVFRDIKFRGFANDNQTDDTRPADSEGPPPFLG